VLISALGLNDLEKVGNAIDQQKSDLLLFGATLPILLFIEEFFFRGFLVKRLGMVPSSIIFAAAHISYGSIAEIIGVFFLGLILAYWYKKHNSLLQNYIAHLAYDLISIAIYLAF